MLQRSAKVKPGQRVLIHGASSGVGTVRREMRSAGPSRALQIPEFKCHVGIFPSRCKFTSNLFHVGSLLLGFQALQKAKKRAWTSWVLRQSGTKHRFCSVRLTVQQQCCSQRLAHWIKPFRWLAVVQLILDFYCLLPIADCLRMIALRRSNPSVQDILREIKEALGLVEIEAELHISRCFLARCSKNLPFRFCTGNLPLDG